MTSNHQPNPHPRLGLAVQWLTTGMGLALIGWLLSGVIFKPPTREFRVASGSMAPTLIGPHVEVICDDCRFPIRCSVEQVPSDSHVVCALCGLRQELEKVRLRPGDLVQLTTVKSHRLQRFDMVAFTSDSEAVAEAKRVAGLPGETVLIRDGDLFVNGSRVQKSLEQFLAMAVVAHDSAYPSHTSPRWNPETPVDDNGWRVIRGFASCTPTDNHKDRVHWLRYTHSVGVASPWTKPAPSPILDEYSANQSLSRELHEVADYVVQVDADLDPGAALTIRFANHFGEIKAVWSRRENVMRVEDGTKVETHQFDFNAPARRIRVGMIDRTFLVALDEETIWSSPHSDTSSEDDKAPHENPQKPLNPLNGELAVLGAAGGSVAIHNVKFLRDIHYLEPDLTHRPWSTKLGDDEFLVLGDNVPVSVDGRRLGPVGQDRILGRLDYR